MADFRELIQKLAAREDLTPAEAADGFEQIVGGTATPAQTGAFLTALALKGETPQEILGCAKTLRDQMEVVQLPKEGAVDTCGTGGDRQRTFNVSTAAGLVAAGAGVSVAKHGNRSVSSSSGSADCLLALGVDVEAPVETQKRCLLECGFCFLYAPAYHKAMKVVRDIRAELGIRTIFNIMGPLLNPAQVKRQVIGVYDEKLADTMVRAMKKLGTVHVMAVAGLDGLDEITITGKTRVVEMVGGETSSYYVSPESFGIARGRLEDLKVASAEESARMVNEVLNGGRGPSRDIAVLNAGAAIRVAGFASSLEKGVEVAKRSIDTGRAKEVLEKLIKLSHV